MFSSIAKVWQGEAKVRTLELAENATVRLPPVRGGAVVRVERGLLLVTREGDGEDHVLSAGMELRLPASGLAVGWAFESSRVQVRHQRSGATIAQPARPATAGASC